MFVRGEKKDSNHLYTCLRQAAYSPAVLSPFPTAQMVLGIQFLNVFPTVYPQLRFEKKKTLTNW